MAHFPIFLNLQGKKVLILGHAPEQAALLASFGAEVQMVDRLREEALNGAALVILAGGDRAEASALCRERNIPVNSVDDPENCTFFFPAIARRGDVTAAVSSGGSVPALAGALREAIEALLPDEEAVAELARLTARLRREVPDHKARAQILKTACREALGRYEL